MPSYTTRMGLTKPAGGEKIKVSDLNGNFDRIDQYAAGAMPVTSSTRPTGANRWDGLVIRETDTGQILMWDGVASKWVGVYPRRSRTTIAAPSFTGNSTIDRMLNGINVPSADYDRKFRVDNYHAWASSVTGSWEVRALLADQGSTNNGSTGEILAANRYVAGSVGGSLSIGGIIAAGESKAIRFWLVNLSAGTINISDINGRSSALEWVEDRQINDGASWI